MANETKSKKNARSTSEVDDAHPADAGPQVEVTSSWTVVEEEVVDDDMKDSNVVQIENIDSDEAVNAPSRMLYRHPEDKMVAGVCGGLANSLGWDPTLVRILWVGATLATFGGAIAAYVAFWLLLPVGSAEKGEVHPATISLNGGNSNILPYAFMGVGALILLGNLEWLGGLVGGFWSVLSILFFPAVMIGIGYMLLDRKGSSKWKESMQDARSSIHTRFQNKVGKVDKETVRNKVKSVRSGMPLRRSRNDRIMTGVIGGISRKIGVEANLIRLGWVLLTFFSGAFPGIVAYIVLSILIPDETMGATAPRRSQKVQDVQIL